MATKPAIETHGLSKRYALGPEGADRNRLSRWLGMRKSESHDRRSGGTGAGKDHIWALRDIDLTIRDGERVGLIGRNGAGKSTLLMILSRVIHPTGGEAVIRGRVTSLLEVGTGFSNNATGRENIYLNASLHGLSRAGVDDRLDAIIDFAELSRFIDTPIKHYSSGMRARLAFAIAAHLDPDILMLDEVLSVGDAAFQRKCLQQMKNITSGTQTLLFVSHSMASVLEFCSRTIWLDQGRVVADGPTEEVSAAYLAAATGLNSSVEIDADGEKSGVGRPVAPENHGTRAAYDEETVARLVSASIVNELGENSSIVSVDRAVGIRIETEVLAPDSGVEPAVHVKDGQQRVAFVAAYLAPDYPSGLCETGHYTLTCWIPAHLLNIGEYSINIHLATPDIPNVRHAQHDDVLSFFVRDAVNGGPSARGRYLQADFPGPVRPMLRWDTERSGDADVITPKRGFERARISGEIGLMNGTSVFDSDHYLAINSARWEIAEVVIGKLSGLGIETVYDVGCGPGWFSDKLSQLGLTVTGLEVRQELLHEARRRVPGARFVEFNADKSPAGEEFPVADLVFCFGLLYHLENPFKAVRRLEALTRSVCLIESVMVADDRPTAQLVEESSCINQGFTHHALIPSHTTLIKMLYVSGFKHVYEFTGQVAHRDFIETDSHFKRRRIFLAAYHPLSIENLERLAEPGAPKYQYEKPPGNLPKSRPTRASA